MFRCNDVDDQAVWSSMAGECEVVQENSDGEGYVTSRSLRTVPVIPPSWFRTFPDFTAAVFYRGMPPVIGRAEVAWERSDVHLLREVGGDATRG